MTYSEKLKDPRWQKKRLDVLERDEWSCQLCRETEITLHVHHKKYEGDPWESPDEDLTTYCALCHIIVEHLKTFHLSFIASQKISYAEEPDKRSMAVLCRDEKMSRCILFFVYSISIGELIGPPISMSRKSFLAAATLFLTDLNRQANG